MTINNFAETDTLVCTMAAMIYRQLQKNGDPTRTKALDECGLVLPWDQRSAKVRHVWESAVRSALDSMGITGDGKIDGLRIYTTPAAAELADEESVF